MLKCLIAFILGWLFCKMMGNGFSVGGHSEIQKCTQYYDTCINKLTCNKDNDACTSDCVDALSACENPYGDKAWVCSNGSKPCEYLPVIPFCVPGTGCSTSKDRCEASSECN